MFRALAELRYAVRTLARTPAFTILALLTLALGIGANTALFSVVRAVLLQPLPYGDQGRAVMIWSSWKDFSKTWVSYDEFEVYREQLPAFADVGLFSWTPVGLTGEGEPEQVKAALVTANIFPILGVHPVLGRGFLEEENGPGGADVVALGYELWQRKYAADPSVVGRTIHLNGEPHVVVGVMPPELRLPLEFGGEPASQLWGPLALDPANLGIPGPELSQNGGSHGFYGLARLAPGVTVERANRELAALGKRHTVEGIYPESWNFRAFAVPLEEEVTGSARPALLVLLGAVALVLLIACANVAGLLLVRGGQRRQELGIRSALGATGGRLARQFLVESAVLAVAGGLLGAWLASLGISALRSIAPAEVPRIGDAGVDLGVLAFALAVSMVTALLFGLLPALRASRTAPGAVLREGGRGTVRGTLQVRARQALVVAEIALAVVLAVGAGLMIRSVGRLLAIDPGFEPRGVLTMQISAPSAMYPEDAQVIAFFSELTRRLEGLPGVRSAGAARLLPLDGEMGDWGLNIEGYMPPPGEGTPGDWQVATPGYFEAMGLRLVAGRTFDARESGEGPWSMVINRRLAEKYFAGRDPLGARIRIGGAQNPQSTVIGVVEDVRQNALTEEVKPQFYAPQGHFPFAPRTMYLVVRTDGDPSALIRPTRELVRGMDARLPVSRIRTMDEIVASSVAQSRFTMVLLGIFAALALVLAAIGIYGVVAQVTAGRVQEFGVRMAMGARPMDVVWLSVRSGLGPALLGTLAGVGGAAVLTRLMQGLVFGVATTDPSTYIVMAALSAGVAAAASLGPARRAATVDPAQSLREN